MRFLPLRLPRLLVPVVLLGVAIALHAAGAKPAPGQASGKFSVAGQEVTLGHALAFVDRKDERKPTIVVLSDKELPAAGWKSESDFMMWRMDHKFIGVAFWLDTKREAFRTDYYDASGFPTSSSGVIDLKLDPPAGKAITGSAHSTHAGETLSEPIKLDVVFNAAVK